MPTTGADSTKAHQTAACACLAWKPHASAEFLLARIHILWSITCLPESPCFTKQPWLVWIHLLTGGTPIASLSFFPSSSRQMPWIFYMEAILPQHLCSKPRGRRGTMSSASAHKANLPLLFVFSVLQELFAPSLRILEKIYVHRL